MKHILVRHEQAAVHAADAIPVHLKDRGRLVTSGPGVTNTVTGIATAYMDSVPWWSSPDRCRPPTSARTPSRECDTVGITRPCVKHNFLVKDVKDLAVTIKKAFHIAATGSPGPVVVDIPKDVTAQMCEFDYPKTIQMRSYNPVVKGHLGQIKKAVQFAGEAKRRSSIPAGA